MMSISCCEASGARSWAAAVRPANPPSTARMANRDRIARMWALFAILAVLGGFAGRTAAAQERAPEASQHEIDIMHHLGNSHAIELPYWKVPYYKEVELPRWAPIGVGS